MDKYIQYIINEYELKATAAALAAAAAATALLRRKGEKTVPESNGIYIAESDRSKILEAINKLSKKTYYINEEGYLQVDETA